MGDAKIPRGLEHWKLCGECLGTCQLQQTSLGQSIKNSKYRIINYQHYNMVQLSNFNMDKHFIINNNVVVIYNHFINVIIESVSANMDDRLPEGNIKTIKNVEKMNSVKG